MSLKAAIGIVENALNHRTVLATGCCVVPINDLECLNRILTELLLPVPKTEKRYWNLYASGHSGAERHSLSEAKDARDVLAETSTSDPPCIGTLCLTFRAGKPDTTVPPEWVK